MHRERLHWCPFDGVEQGSTGGLIGEWSYPDLSWVNAKKTIIANESYALAA
jgi:hypothetical protein